MAEPAPCNHLKLDSKKCGGNALREHAYCYYHQRYHDITDLPTGHRQYSPPVFEDSRSVLLAIHQILRSFLSGSMDSKARGLALYGYQVAASVIPRKDARSPLEQEQLESQERALQANTSR
jgi:hypothetical protein